MSDEKRPDRCWCRAELEEPCDYCVFVLIPKESEENE
jgi:hypothetical protein